jgi:hypothetical protein
MAEATKVTLSAEDLKTIIAAAVSEAVKAAKQPSVMEQMKLDEAAKELAVRQQDRKESAAQMVQMAKNKQQSQRICSHTHARGQTHCVFIQDGNYILCQLCQAIVRPDSPPSGYKGGDIFDTNLFNKLFQNLNSLGTYQ